MLWKSIAIANAWASRVGKIMLELAAAETEVSRSYREVSLMLRWYRILETRLELATMFVFSRSRDMYSALVPWRAVNA